MFLVSAYAPVGTADNNVWDDFFANLSRCIARKQRGDILLIGADTNSSMGCKSSIDEHFDGYRNVVGRFGLRHTNNVTYLDAHHVLS